MLHLQHMMEACIQEVLIWFHRRLSVSTQPAAQVLLPAELRIGAKLAGCTVLALQVTVDWGLRLRTGAISLKDARCGEGEGVSNPEAFLADGSMGLGSDWLREEPRLPGDMKRETMSWEPSFSHRLLGSCIAALLLSLPLSHLGSARVPDPSSKS